MSAPQKRKPGGNPASADHQSKPASYREFLGTDNPRHLRVIVALKVRPLPRETLDGIAGCSNGPELVAELRRRGLRLPCTRTKRKDMDLFDVYPGVYHLTQADRRRIARWERRVRAARGLHD